MNLVYIDESGNTGLDFKDRQQPVFVLAATIIHAEKWFEMERRFYKILRKYFNNELPEDFEIHAYQIRNRTGVFKKFNQEQCLTIRDELFGILLEYEIPIIYRRIIKSKFEEFCESQYGSGIKINPYIMALPFVCMQVNDYLKQKGDNELGMLIFDEQKESFDDAEKSLRTLRLDPNSLLKTTHLIEKGFFVDSKKSFALQLADIAALTARKYEEEKMGKPANQFGRQAFDKLNTLVSKGTRHKMEDIFEWIKHHYVRNNK